MQLAENIEYTSERHSTSTRVGHGVARVALLTWTFGALLVAGCTVSLGVTNSPPAPDQCVPGYPNCRAEVLPRRG